MSDRERCAMCQHSKPVLTEMNELPVCQLPKRAVWACLTGSVDRFAPKEEEDG